MAATGKSSGWVSAMLSGIRLMTRSMLPLWSKASLRLQWGMRVPPELKAVLMDDDYHHRWIEFNISRCAVHSSPRPRPIRHRRLAGATTASLAGEMAAAAKPTLLRLLQVAMALRRPRAPLALQVHPHIGAGPPRRRGPPRTPRRTEEAAVGVRKRSPGLAAEAEQRALASGREAAVLEFYSPRPRLCASLQGLVRELEGGAGGWTGFVIADAEDDRWLAERALASGRDAAVLEFYSPRLRLCVSLQGLVRELEDGAGGWTGFAIADAEDDRWLPEHLLSVFLESYRWHFNQKVQTVCAWWIMHT
uniref:Uncharacterized protein n=1 Tax=Oryza barthii TaxID=65489 RepID=A0A0D3HNP2_9ORYZ